MRVVFKTDVGRVRKENQDWLLVEPPLYAVADGMGGHKGGKEASLLAATVLKEALKNKAPDKELLLTAMEAANRRIYEKQEEDESLSGMGTTLSVIWAGESEMLIGHVGDSRIYLVRNGIVAQLTQDHSLVAELMKNGYITALEASVHPYKNVITRAIGTNKSVLIDTFKVPCQKNDKWLICSDGLHGMLTHDALAEALAAPDLDKAAEKLLAAALENGGTDNISFILLAKEEAEK
jgi:Serine/threonine protein phosphatase